MHTYDGPLTKRHIEESLRALKENEGWYFPTGPYYYSDEYMRLMFCEGDSNMSLVPQKGEVYYAVFADSGGNGPLLVPIDTNTYSYRYTWHKKFDAAVAQAQNYLKKNPKAKLQILSTEAWIAPKDIPVEIAPVK